MDKPRYLIDTNAVIDYLGKKLPENGIDLMNEVFDSGPIVSVITKIELLGFNAPKDYHELLNNFINDALVLHLTNDVIDASIEIRKKYKPKLPDAVIAGTAVANKLTLISRNISDFRGIKGLKMIDPYHV